MKFIWAKGLRDEMNVTLAFLWTCNSPITAAELSICATQAYRVWKNGALAGHGPARAAHGCVRKDVYFWESLNVGDVIVVEVSAYNVRCLSVAGRNPCFAAEISAGGKIVADSGDFKCYRVSDRKQKVLRYSFQRAFVESYDMEICRSSFYRGESLPFSELPTEELASPRILNRNVPYPALNQTFTESYVERGRIYEKKTYEVWRDRAHNITDIFDGFPLFELEEDVSAEVCKLAFSPSAAYGSMSFEEGEYGVFDFERTLSGFFRLRLNAVADSVLYLIYDEKDGRTERREGEGISIDFKRNDTCNVVKYSLKKGSYDLLTFEPVSARYTRLCVVKGGIELESFGFVSYENPDIFGRKFIIKDRELSAIMRAAQNTLAQNSTDILMDCPSRERAGWINDAFFSGRAEYMLTGANKSLCNLLENYALSPVDDDLPKGMIPMCYPGDFPNHDFIPNCAMWFVIVLYDYYKRSHDDKLVELCREKVYGALSYFSAYENEYELLEDLDGWIFIEWSAANDKNFIRGVNFPSNITYCKILRCAGELYKDDALSQKADRINRRIRELSFDGEFFADNAVRDAEGKLVRTKNYTETCQYFTFFFGLADKEEYPTLYNTLMDNFGCFRKEESYPEIHPSNALIGFLLRLDLLRQDKQYEKLLSEVKSYYGKMAEATGTLWEHKNAFASLNHGFASYVAVFIAEALGFTENLF